MPVYTWNNSGLKLANLLKEAGLTQSTSDVYRKIGEGALSIDGEKITDRNFDVNSITKNEFIIKIGNRKFLKVKKNF